MKLISGLAVILVVLHIIGESAGAVYRNLADELMNECLRAAHCNLIQGDIARESKLYKNDPKPFYDDAKLNIEKYKEHKKSKDKKIMKECKSRHDNCKPWKMARKSFSLKRVQFDGCSYTSFTYVLFFCKNLKQWPEGYANTIFGKDIGCEKFMTTCTDQKQFTKYHLDRGVKKSDFPADWDKKKELDKELELEYEDETTTEPTKQGRKLKKGRRF